MNTTLTRDNIRVKCPNASSLGFGQLHCNRGNWVVFEIDDHHQFGRSIGRVICDGKIYIEMAVASTRFDSAYIRWIEPHQVREVRRAPPRAVFNFFAAETWNPKEVFAQLEYGVSDLRDQMEGTQNV
jgi:hypothetical protein